MPHSSQSKFAWASRWAPALAMVLLTGAAARPAHAQRVLGVGDDALVLPRGAARVRVLGAWTSFDQRYGLGTPGRAAGALEPVAVDFSLDTLGLVQFPALGGVQEGIRELTGIRDFGISLGRTVAASDVRITTIPLMAELGVTRRLTLAAVVPLVRARQTVNLDVNPSGLEGNVGFNPAASAVAARQANALVQAQFTAATTRLTGLLQACATPPASSTPQCAEINANRASATALIQQASAFAGGVGRVYGDGARAGSPFVPIVGTDAQLAVQARVAGFSRLFAQFGVTELAATTFPAAATARLGYEDTQTILTDPAYGIAGARLETIEGTGVGDVEIAGKFKFLDSFGGDERARFTPRGFNYRSALTGALRLGTGAVDLPANFFDVGTGTGANAVSLRSATDLLFGGRFWTSVVGRYTAQLPDQQTLRITDRPERVLAAQFREQQVDRDLGNVVELELTPRYVLTDYFAVSAQYYFRSKGQDRYTGTFTIDSATTGYGAVTLDASTLDQETEAREHRVGGGVSFSTLAAFDQGRARLPVEITYFRFQTVRGSGGNVPKLFGDQLQVRVYFRLFGR